MVTPSSTDVVTHQIQRRLGNYDIVKDLFEDVPKLLGIDSNHPPASPAPFPSQASAASRAQGEFKKPSAAHHNNHHGHHSAPRGGFVKPTDGKPPYGGRGGYPGQPVKHGVPASNDHRANGIVPPKGPPVGGSRIHQTSRSLPRLHVGQGQRDSLSGGQPELENILKEMKSVMVTPLTGIATPRKEPESKFIFNPHLAGYVSSSSRVWWLCYYSIMYVATPVRSPEVPSWFPSPHLPVFPATFCSPPITLEQLHGR
uniref:Uncharacterized protein n=1 Tax=Timema bartmani TaxID=61472 RepID=A0A7R9EQT9_9NEOP|nr:unnamed protein product [Timema bartmani]